MKSLRLFRPFSLLCLLGAIGFLSGCSATMEMPDTLDGSAPTSDLGVVKGGVYGGRQPITASHLYLFQATNNTGYGTNVATSLLGNTASPNDLAGKCTSANHAVTLPLVWDGTRCYYLTGGANPGATANPSDTQPGGFNLNGLYACTPGDNVWIFSINGFPTTGTTASLRNPYASLMADLGTCPTSGAANFGADTYIYVNELSTVAMAYAVAGFTGNTDIQNAGFAGVQLKISSPSSNITGLNNAFATAQQLYNIFGSGDQGDLSAPQTTPYGAHNGITPYYLINTVGDMLASCVNSAGENTGSPVGACANLFQGTYGNTTTFTDTASAAISIAQHPAALTPDNLGELLNLSTSDGPWFPNNTSSGSPTFNDLAAAIQYSGTSTLLGTFSPAGISSDPNGNLYTNAYSANGYLVRLTPLGAISTTASGSIKNGSLVAVAHSGLIWAPGANLGNVYSVTNTTALTSVTSPVAAGTLTAAPHPIAADNTGFVYVGDGGNAQVLETNGGTTLTVPGATPGNGCFTGLNGIALDNSGVLWTTGTGSPDVVCRVSSAGGIYFGVGSSSSPTSIFSANGIAIDANQNAWVTTAYSSIYEIDHTSGNATLVNGGGGTSGPNGVTVDGSENVWITNKTTGSISELNNAGDALSGGNGFQKSILNNPTGIVADISGNIWVANYGDSNVVELVGIATPTAALSQMTPGVKP